VIRWAGTHRAEPGRRGQGGRCLISRVFVARVRGSAIWLCMTVCGRWAQYRMVSTTWTRDTAEAATLDVAADQHLCRSSFRDNRLVL